MGSSKSKRKTNEKRKSKTKKSQPQKEKINAKMLAIALIFIMLFVSYVVIFSSPDKSSPSKNMVFREDKDEIGTWYGNVENIDENLSNINLSIKDISADSTNKTSVLEHGMIIETNGNFNCTFLDENDNGKLDKEDSFIVHNANAGDWIKVYKKTSDKAVAYYTF